MRRFSFLFFLLIPLVSCSQVNVVIKEPVIRAVKDSIVISFDTPEDSLRAYLLGKKFAQDLNNYLIDFKKNGDLMVHVSSFYLFNDYAYVTYYANRKQAGETPPQHIARFVRCNLNNCSEMEYYDIQGAIDSGLPSEKTIFDEHIVTEIYDTILMSIDGGESLNIMWAASLDGVYTRLYQTYNTKTGVFGPISYNFFKVNNSEGIMNVQDMDILLSNNQIHHKPLSIDIGIMQKITGRLENGEMYYYTGCYANKFSCIIKSKDLITWEYVSSPDFECLSEFENAVYIKDDKAFYFCRQEKKERYAFLTYYDINNNTWHDPVYVEDSQSRSDFFEYEGKLYAVHAPIDRNHLAVMEIDIDDISNSRDIQVAQVPNYFYPFVRQCGDELYMSFTASRQHIFLSNFTIERGLK